MFGDLAMPITEHSAAILAGSWPSQSVTAWSGYSTTLDAAARNLFSQLDIQHDIRDLLAPMEGNFIDAARGLEATRETALENRIEAYRHVSKQALWGANELHATKADLVEIVNKAEEDIHSARQAAAQAKAANPLATPQIDSQLASTEAAIVARATALARARDLQGAGTVAALAADIGRWTAPHKAPSAGGTPSPPAPPHAPQPAPPAPHGGGARTTPVDRHGTTRENPASGHQGQEGQQGHQPGKQYQESTWRKPETGTHGPGSPSPLSNTPGTGSSPSPGSSAGSGPGSMINSLMKPMTGGSSPASSAARGGGLGNPGGGSASSAGQLGNANAASPSNAAAAGRGGGGASLAGLGSGIAEVSARAASGAISGAANVLGAVGSVGNQVAQNVAAAAAQAPAAVPAATPPPPAPPGGGAGPPMAMMPPAGGGPGAVTPVGGGPGGPASPPAPAPPPPGGAAVPGGGSPAGPQVAPMVLSQRGTRGIGADGASGDALVEQAMDVGQAVIASMLTQTLGVGYIGIDYAVSLISERTGSVSAWLATSEGASYIPLGVRVPADVRLALTDPVIGHDLFEKSTAAGGANALETVVRHAEAREMAAPGTRVLAIASSLPMEQMVDWAAAVGARPVSVLAEQAGSIAPVQGPLVHRCAVAMPWEWRQANAFNDQQRLQVAARHMHMAALAGHLHGAACETVMRQFELRQPIEDSLWDDVRTERFMALVDYELEMQTQGQGGSDPARLLASARAAEVIECLRNYDTAEGCADLLYAARLAGAPLNPVAAVV
jgi:hypothetical protein